MISYYTTQGLKHSGVMLTKLMSFGVRSKRVNIVGDYAKGLLLSLELLSITVVSQLAISALVGSKYLHD